MYTYTTIEGYTNGHSFSTMGDLVKHLVDNRLKLKDHRWSIYLGYYHEGNSIGNEFDL